ncbi:LCM-domain-containing protein [Metschnikowia bicuspidata var. bicuspidata NRRL YB-4993]|uniref:tRNA wybutosine-synthesizing protein 4 n=1 Tax=Metschnikowia bicuspidata var. bicuspidata NRRL YB-4993 TaxID=869754 RepID=A0A1A0H6M9_9ASCO|nr:LCM-domain-containing protein [Metschnikowia bicuspidata var. bicuspidata NRRL YB-4993]OBA19681.1 LCM-domain-containing protein [Metschnikowia bicuspidata var. bicuspidata NRRL YB-4993]
MGIADPAAVAAQNRRKIEKDKRRRNYHDSQVQGTNNSSIVSKRSVEKIYSPITEPESKEWFKFFVPKGKRRSPAINRGYWVRMESIKQAVQRIRNQYGGTIRVVNLGCGFDPYPFKTLAESGDAFEFFDFDYPDLVARKLALIRDAPEIMDVIGAEELILPEHKSLGVVMSTASYKLVGCDLKNTALYQKQLNTLLHSGVATVFIAEVSLAYMKPEHANPVVQILSQLPNSHVLVLEQIMPSGDSHFFAQKMLYHFSHLRSPLQCKQKARFQEYFPQVEIIDLFESWSQLVSSDMKKLVAEVEDFDEWEEFIVFCQHYVVIHATNSEKLIFEATQEPPAFDSIEPLKISVMDNPINTKFPACTATQTRTYVHGGMFQTRSDELIFLGQNTPVFHAEEADKPSARMCHTLSDLGNGNLLLIGGRTRPGVELDDVWVYQERKETWRLVGDIGEKMARHSAVSIEKGKVLVFGKGKFKLVNYVEDVFSVVDLSSTGDVPVLSSCGVSYNSSSGVGYIVGGTLEETGPTISEELFSFRISNSGVFMQSEGTSAHFARIGCLSKIEDGQLYILGGAGHTLQDQNSTVVKYDPCRKRFCGMRFPDTIWKTYPLFIGSQLAGNAVVGGGAVCYSFGSCYNNGYLLG